MGSWRVNERINKAEILGFLLTMHRRSYRQTLCFHADSCIWGHSAANLVVPTTGNRMVAAFVSKPKVTTRDRLGYRRKNFHCQVHE